MRWVAVAMCACLAVACDGAPERREAQQETSRSPGPPVPAATTGPAPAVVPPSPAPTAPGPCRIPAGYPELWRERPRYTARLVIPADRGPVTGEIDVRFVPDADTDRLVFRLWPNAPRLGRSGGRAEVAAAFVNGELTAGTYEPGGAAPGRPGTVFWLPGSFPAGRPVTARIEFRLVMPGPVNDRVSRIGSTFRLGSVFPVLSWIRGDGWHTAAAVDSYAESAASEVADWDVRVEAPAGSTVLATGAETEPGRFVAEAVRDWAATVAPMRTGEASAQGGRTTVVVGVAANASGDPVALARLAASALDGMAGRWGEYPYSRLTIGVSPSLTGGIEFPTHIHFGSTASRTSLVHEVGHQWFYGLAGNDQYRDPWLDEALATYAEARFNGRLAAQRSRSVPALGRTHLGESWAFWRSHGGSYHQAVYLGGLQALGVLADRLGGYDALDCALRRYLHDRAFTVSRPADFFDAVAAQSGVDARAVLAPFGLR
jgi:hypothetical protein